MFVLRDLHFVSWETILGSRICICISIWDTVFQKTHPPTTLLFLHSPRHFLGEYVSPLQFLEVRVQIQYCDDSAELMALQYCSIYRSILWGFCHIEDPAVLMSLPYCSAYDFNMETTLPYWGLCRIVLHYAFSAVHSFVNVSDTSFALRDSPLSLDRCPF